MRAGFDLESFYTRVQATRKERGPLRQDLVRGLKDWCLQVYGYDRYGAETAFLLRDRMTVPRIFGFAVLRVLRDRRISSGTKTRVAAEAFAMTDFEEDEGVPYAFLAPALHLAREGQLSPSDLRFALIVASASPGPFVGLEKGESVEFLRILLASDELPPAERALWSHALVSQHQELAGANEVIRTLLGSDRLPAELRRELCWAWINRRQPRFEVTVPPPGDEPRSHFVAGHMPFWVAHVRSWPSAAMTRLAVFWLSRLGEDPLALAERFIGDVGPYSEQLDAGVADVLAEQYDRMPREAVERLIQRGISTPGSAPTRRRFYAVAATILGPEYLDRAAQDPAGSVRQWATRARERAALAPKDALSLPSSLGD